MLKIFIGLIIVAIDINFALTTIGAPLGVLELLPDFIGYLLILWGSGEIKAQNWRFTKYRWLTFVMFVISLIALTLRIYNSASSLLIGIVGLVACAGFHVQMSLILKAMRDIDEQSVLHTSLTSAMSMLYISLICEIAVFVCGWVVPAWELYAFYFTMLETIAMGFVFIKTFVFYRAYRKAGLAA